MIEALAFLLSFKIAIGALVIAGGFYFLVNAASKICRLKVGKTVLLYPVFGLLGVGLGGLFIAHSLFGY